MTDAEFKRFLDEVVTPRFPAGVTVISAFRQFQNSFNVVLKDPVFQTTVIFPLSMRDGSRKVEQIRTAYKQQFQVSVLRFDGLTAVTP